MANLANLRSHFSDSDDEAMDEPSILTTRNQHFQKKHLINKLPKNNIHANTSLFITSSSATTFDEYFSSSSGSDSNDDTSDYIRRPSDHKYVSSVNSEFKDTHSESLNEQDAEFVSLYAQEVFIQEPNMPQAKDKEHQDCYEENDMLLEDSVDMTAMGINCSLLPKFGTDADNLDDEFDEELERWESSQIFHGQNTNLLHSTNVASKYEHPTTIRPSGSERLSSFHKAKFFVQPKINVEETTYTFNDVCSFASKTVSYLKEQLSSSNARIQVLENRILGYRSSLNPLPMEK